MDIASWIIANAERITVVSVLLGAVYVLVSGLLIPRGTHKAALMQSEAIADLLRAQLEEVTAERNVLLEMALRGTNAVEKSTNALSDAITLAKRNRAARKVDET